MKPYSQKNKKSDDRDFGKPIKNRDRSKKKRERKGAKREINRKLKELT